MPHPAKVTEEAYAERPALEWLGQVGWQHVHGPSLALGGADTSVLIGAEAPQDLEGAISAASLVELHFGTLVARDDDERARRAQRLGVVEATFEPIPIDTAVAREWGRLAAAVAQRGGKSRRRAIDLAIAATANNQGVPLLTADTADLAIIDDLVEVRAA